MIPRLKLPENPRILSLFSGIGALDLAVEYVTNGRVVCHVESEPHCKAVLERHWPLVPVIRSVEAVGRHNYAAFQDADVICGGFPCTDLSQAGARKGLDGPKSGLWKEMLRIITMHRAHLVFIENVPRLLHYRERIEKELGDLGYGVHWISLPAALAGAPHRRRRVFAIAVYGGEHAEPILMPNAPSEGAWPTPTASRPNESESLDSWLTRAQRLSTTSRPLSPPLGIAVRMNKFEFWPTPTAADGRGGAGHGVMQGSPSLRTAAQFWPTPTAGDAKASGSRCLDSNAHSGVSLTDAVRDDRAKLWPTPSARAYRSGSGSEGGHPGKVGSPDLPELLGGRLNPAWVETLMGLPVGYTLPVAYDAAGRPSIPSLTSAAHARVADPLWPALQGQEQHDWEPSRLIPPGAPKQPGRPARLKALGNAVVPQQAVLAYSILLRNIHAQEEARALAALPDTCLTFTSLEDVIRRVIAHNLACDQTVPPQGDA